MDFSIVVPLSETAAQGAWKTSPLEGVKAYILNEGDRKSTLTGETR